jgi:hypothetical protein
MSNFDIGPSVVASYQIADQLAWQIAHIRTDPLTTETW